MSPPRETNLLVAPVLAATAHVGVSSEIKPIASCRIPPVLALEVPPPGRPAANRRRSQLLIRRMSVDNPLWGAPRIHGELLKLGFEVAQASVAKYMVKRCGPPSQDRLRRRKRRSGRRHQG